MSDVDRLILTVLVEGYIDMLVGDAGNIKRTGLKHHFDPRTVKPLAENGISMLVEAFNGSNKYTALFDVGLTPGVIKNNFKALNIDPSSIDHIVISHGHPDHYGGLPGALEAIGHPVPVAIHPDAFHPRYVLMAAGDVIPFYNYSLQEQWETLGARMVHVTEPMRIGPGIYLSGEIPFEVSFEPPKAPPGRGGGLFHVKGGKFVEDRTLDDLAVGIVVKEKGLVVLTGCAHAGILNSIRQLQKVTSCEKVYAVLGGFHLGFPGVPRENVSSTLEEIRMMKPALVSPMHCSGFSVMATFEREMPEQFCLSMVGTKITL
jgi:7,8-dihydropterin-6-yl-methyl-4-(beta-D-ribofuranosyl)aminobenzene 5'-phosphate synthase